MKYLCVADALINFIRNFKDQGWFLSCSKKTDNFTLTDQKQSSKNLSNYFIKQGGDWILPS